MTNPFKTEAELCAAFSACVPSTWQAYPETCGFDIVLAHKETGAQIGIEAKLTLNAKVLVQVTDNREHTGVGPDYHAVLVGRVVAENAVLAGRLGVKVLTLVPRVDKIHRFSRVAPRGYPETDWVVNRGGRLASRAFRLQGPSRPQPVGQQHLGGSCPGVTADAAGICAAGRSRGA